MDKGILMYFLIKTIENRGLDNMGVTFTVTQIACLVVGIFGFVLTLLNIYDKVIRIKVESQKPLKDIEIRVDAMEKWSKLVDMRLDEGSKHFDRLDEGNKIVQQSLLALMDSALSENGKCEELKRARDSLYDYLSGK